MGGSGLQIVVTPEKFKKLNSDEKLDVIYQAQLNQQARCSETIDKYDEHFNLCNGKISSADSDMGELKKSVGEVKDELTNISIKRRKIDIGTGAGIGAPAGVAIVEALRALVNFFKG